MDSQNLFSAGLLMTMFVVVLGVAILFAFLVYNAYSSVPAQFQQIPANQVWLLLIPVFGWYWNFILYPKISQSYRLYAQSKNMDDGSDYGEQQARIYAICSICSIIPCVGGIIGLVGFVFWILYIVKIYDYKKRLA